YLRRSYPELMERSRVEIDALLVELKEWEKDPSVYKQNPALSQRLMAKFVALCEAFVRNEDKIAPVYVRPELMFFPGPETIGFAKWLESSYQLVPKGLNFELMHDNTFHDPGELHLQTRGLADGTLRFENDDVVKLKVLPAYTTMLIN